MKLRASTALLLSCTLPLLFLWVFLAILINRTRFTEYGTSLSLIPLIGFHLLALVVLCIAIVVYYKSPQDQKIARMLIFGSSIVELIFFGLNFFGIVWYYQKGKPIGILELLRSFF